MQSERQTPADRASGAAEYEALLTTVTRLVRDPEAPAALAGDAEGWLAAGGLSPDAAAQLAALGDRRLLVYRRHVRRSLEYAVRLEVPRTAARLGDAFGVWVNRWIDAEGPRSRYFRDMAFELVAWAAPRWATDAELPGYLGDLARHELVHFEVGCAPDPPDVEAVAGDIALDRAVRFDGAVRVRRYDHAVHRLSEALDARDVPPREPTSVLVYRDTDLDVRLLELTPLAAEVLERLLRGEPLGGAVSGACAALGSPLDAAVTQTTAALLEELRERGVILGGEAC
jgi:hypothetical protein